MRACEQIKKDLSSPSCTQASIELAHLLPDKTDLKLKITKPHFESLCSPLFKETVSIVERVLEAGDVQKDDVDEVVLVGGSSRIPKIRELLTNMFGKEKMNMSINPDEAVACGAAVQAAILNGNQHKSLEDTILLDVAPLSLGTTVRGEIASVIIPRNTPISVKMSERFVTVCHNQTCVSIQVVEGERHMSKDNNILGEFLLTGLPPAPAGVEGCDVEFDIDANGILKVTAVNEEAGVKNEMTVDSNTSGRLTAEDIEELVEKAEKLKKADEKEEKRMTALSNLELFCENIQFDRTLTLETKFKVSFKLIFQISKMFINCLFPRLMLVWSG